MQRRGCGVDVGLGLGADGLAAGIDQHDLLVDHDAGDGVGRREVTRLTL